MKKNVRLILIFGFLAVFLGFIVFCFLNQNKSIRFPTEPRQLATAPLVTEPPTVPEATTIPVSIENNVTTQPDALPGGATVQPSRTYVRPIGRTVFQNGIRWFSLSGCGVEFLCSGNSVVLTFVVPDSSSLVSHHRPRIGVFVNGVLTRDVVLESETTPVSVSLNGAAGATVKVIKLSESMHSSVGLAGITCSGTEKPTPSPERAKIEFIGDSITAGFGLDETNSNAQFSTRTQNFSETYAYLCATALGCDCWGVAYSGYGVLSGYSEGGVMKPDAVLGPYYEKALTNCRAVDESATVWPFTENAPNYIVINLGTNDATYCYTEARREAFSQRYQELLSQVRSHNPGAFILCVLGDMNNSLYPYIERAVSAYCASTFDTGVRCMTLEFGMDVYPATIAGHPSKESNFVAAQALTNALWQMMR